MICVNSEVKASLLRLFLCQFNLASSLRASSVNSDSIHNLPIVGPRLLLEFNASFFEGSNDTLTVREPGWEIANHGPPNGQVPYPMSLGDRGQPFADLEEAGMLTADLLAVLSKDTWRPGAPGGSHNMLYTSPLEVRYGGSRTNLSDGGYWLSARLEPLCYEKTERNAHSPGAFLSVVVERLLCEKSDGHGVAIVLMVCRGLRLERHDWATASWMEHGDCVLAAGPR